MIMYVCMYYHFNLRVAASPLREDYHLSLPWQIITEGTTSYTFFSTNEPRRIRQHISFSSSNLIYMTQCNECNMQHIGETKRQLRDRFAEHRCSIEKARNPHHFYQPPFQTTSPFQIIPSRT